MKYSKYFRVVILGIFSFILTIGTLISCSLYIGESHFSIQSDFSLFGCLNNFDKKILRYVNGDLKDKEIQKVSSCIINAVELFQSYVDGKKQDEFTPSELRKFVETFFLQDRHISDALLKELMVIKRMIAGGSLDKLTSSDIDQFITFIEIITKEIIFLKYYVQAIYDPTVYVITLSEQGHLSNIQDHLQQVVLRTSHFFNTFVHSYSIDNFRNLINELDFIYNGKQDILGLEDKIAFIKSIKHFIIEEGDPSVIQSHEWSSFLTGLSYLVTAGIHSLIAIERGIGISVDSMESIMNITRSTLDFLLYSFELNSERVISREQLTSVGLQLQKIGIVQPNLSKEGIESLLLMIVAKAFNIEEERYGMIELTLPKMQKIKLVLDFWINMQDFFNHIVRQQNSLPEDKVTPELLKSMYSKNNFLMDNWNYIEQLVFLKPFHLFNYRIHLSHKLRDFSAESFDYRNFTIYHLYHLLAELMKMGYQSSYPASSGLNQLELNTFFQDFEPFGIDMDWLTSSQKETVTLERGELEMIVANILTFSAQGFDLHKEGDATANEIVEYVSYIVSSSNSTTAIISIISNNCLMENADDEKKRYNVDCVRGKLISALKQELDNLPDLLDHLDTLDVEQEKNFVNTMLESSFVMRVQYETIDYLTDSNIQNIINFLFIVETVFNRYDINHDFILSQEEVNEAYPVYKNYIQRHLIETACITEDVEDYSYDFFSHLLITKSLKIIEQIQSQYDDDKNVVTSDDSFRAEDVDGDSFYLSSTRNLWRLFYWSKYKITNVVGSPELDRRDLLKVYSEVVKIFFKARKEINQGSVCQSEK